MNKWIIFVAVSSIPASASAQGTLQSLIAVAGKIIGILTSAATMLGIVAFFYGLALYIFNVSNDDKKEEGKSWMLWGVIAVFVLITVWGILGLLQKTVGNEQGPGKVDIKIPRF